MARGPLSSCAVASRSSGPRRGSAGVCRQRSPNRRLSGRRGSDRARARHQGLSGAHFGAGALHTRVVRRGSRARGLGCGACGPRALEYVSSRARRPRGVVSLPPSVPRVSAARAQARRRPQAAPPRGGLVWDARARRGGDRVRRRCRRRGDGGRAADREAPRVHLGGTAPAVPWVGCTGFPPSCLCSIPSCRGPGR